MSDIRSTIEFYRGTKLDPSFENFYIRDANQTRLEWEGELEQFKVEALTMESSYKQRLDRPILINHFVEDFQNSNIDFAKITNRDDYGNGIEKIFYVWLGEPQYVNSGVTALPFKLDDFYTNYWSAKDSTGILFGKSKIIRAHYDFGRDGIYDPYAQFQLEEHIESGPPIPYHGIQINDPAVAFYVIPYAPSIEDSSILPSIGQGIPSVRTYVAIAFNPYQILDDGSQMVYDMVDANTGLSFFQGGKVNISGMSLSKVQSLLNADPEWSGGGQYIFGGPSIKKDIGYPYTVTGNTVTIGDKFHNFVKNNQYDKAYRASCEIGTLPYLANAAFSTPRRKDTGNTIYNHCKMILEGYLTENYPSLLDEMYAENGEFLHKLTHFVSLSVISNDGVVQSFQIPELSGGPNDQLIVDLLSSAHESGREDYYVYPFVNPKAMGVIDGGIQYAPNRQDNLSRRAVAQMDASVAMVLNDYNMQMYSQQNSNRQAVANAKIGEKMTNMSNANSMKTNSMQNAFSAQNMAMSNANARANTNMSNNQSLVMANQVSGQNTAMQDMVNGQNIGMGAINGAISGATSGSMFGIPGMLAGAGIGGLAGAAGSSLEAYNASNRTDLSNSNMLANASTNAANASAMQQQVGNQAAAMLAQQNKQGTQIAQNNADVSNQLAKMTKQNALDNLSAGYNDLKLSGGTTVGQGSALEYMYQTSGGEARLVSSVPNLPHLRDIIYILTRNGSQVSFWANPADYMFGKAKANYLQCSNVKISRQSNIPTWSSNNMETLLERGVTIWHDMSQMDWQDYTGNSWI